MSAEIKATEEETQVDVQKRAFMSKFGKYAIAGAGMGLLMGPAMSTANAYDSDYFGHDTNSNGLTDTCSQHELFGYQTEAECIASLGE